MLRAAYSRVARSASRQMRVSSRAFAAKPGHDPFKWDSEKHWRDMLNLEDQLTDDERAIRDVAQKYCQEKLMPRVLDGFRHETTDPSVFRYESFLTIN